MNLSLADHWSGLATTALLGSGRRPVPDAPTGAVADLVTDRTGVDPAESVLDQVALLAAARRAGLRPNPAVPLLVPCPVDPRPVCPPAAVRRLPQLLAEWPHLVDEWARCVGLGGWSLPPEVVVALLARFRGDPDRRAAIAGLAGEMTTWLAELFPHELAPSRPSARAAGVVAPPDVPIPEDIARLGTLAPAELAATLAGALQRGRFTNRHRASLVRFVSAVPVDHLGPLVEALARSATNPDTMGLTFTLGDLAKTRLDLIRELMP